MKVFNYYSTLALIFVVCLSSYAQNGNLYKLSLIDSIRTIANNKITDVSALKYLTIRDFLKEDSSFMATGSLFVHSESLIKKYKETVNKKFKKQFDELYQKRICLIKKNNDTIYFPFEFKFDTISNDTIFYDKDSFFIKLDYESVFYNGNKIRFDSLFSTDDKEFKNLKEFSRKLKYESDTISIQFKEFLINKIDDKIKKEIESNFSKSSHKIKYGFEGSTNIASSQISLSSELNLNSNSYVDAISTFLAERIKTEAKIELIDKFSRLILSKDKENQLFSTLLPGTCTFLKTAQSNYYSRDFNLLLIAYRKDFNSIPLRLHKITKSIVPKTNDEEVMKFIDYITVIIEGLNGLQQGKTHIQILNEINLEKINNDDLKISIYFLQTISEFLQDFGYENNSWVNREVFGSIINDPDKLEYFRFLFEQKIKNNTKLDKSKVLEIITKSLSKKTFSETLNSFYQIASATDNVYASILKMREEGRQIGTKELLIYYSTIFEAMQFSIKKFGFEEGLTQQKYVNITNSVELLFNATAENDYVTIVYELINFLHNLSKYTQLDAPSIQLNHKSYSEENMKKFLRSLGKDKIEKSIDSALTSYLDDKNIQVVEEEIKIKKIIFSLIVDSILQYSYDRLSYENKGLDFKKIEKAYKDIINKLNDDKNFIDIQLASITTDYSKDLIKYLGFSAALLQAKNSEEIKQVLTQYALPPGSYRTKRKSLFDISINAYPGIVSGVERPVVENKWSGNIGFTAPIGISFSWGSRKKGYSSVYYNNIKFKNGKLDNVNHLSERSLSLFVGVLDLGAPVLYRLTNGSEGFPEDVSFEQFASPSIYGFYGFRNSVITAGLGTSITPHLRTFEGSSTTAWSINAVLAFDIPIFNIFTKSVTD